ncbi:unnamed protein product [Adineta steineri]|uniref:Uncharacterized protein n=1 Tax=Adineta steineri TaxID=433720 RepID=A0A818YJE8_9BILA|nr:unnamed protein product [Adineta steineri]
MFSVRVIYNIFRRVDRQFINYIPAFVNTRECPCRTDLGTIEPLDYSFNYSIDENFPVIDLDTNTTSIEKHYICEAPRIAETIKFLHKPPFVVVDVGRHSSSMAELPDPLFIGNYNYCLSPGINSANEHFTVIIKSNDNCFYHFDDTNHLGCVGCG